MATLYNNRILSVEQGAYVQPELGGGGIPDSFSGASGTVTIVSVRMRDNRDGTLLYTIYDLNGLNNRFGDPVITVTGKTSVRWNESKEIWEAVIGEKIEAIANRITGEMSVAIVFNSPNYDQTATTFATVSGKGGQVSKQLTITKTPFIGIGDITVYNTEKDNVTLTAQLTGAPGWGYILDQDDMVIVKGYDERGQPCSDQEDLHTDSDCKDCCGPPWYQIYLPTRTGENWLAGQPGEVDQNGFPVGAWPEITPTGNGPVLSEALEGMPGSSGAPIQRNRLDEAFRDGVPPEGWGFVVGKSPEDREDFNPDCWVKMLVGNFSATLKDDGSINDIDPSPQVNQRTHSWEYQWYCKAALRGECEGLSLRRPDIQIHDPRRPDSPDWEGPDKFKEKGNGPPDDLLDMSWDWGLGRDFSGTGARPAYGWLISSLPDEGWIYDPRPVPAGVDINDPTLDWGVYGWEWTEISEDADGNAERVNEPLDVDFEGDEVDLSPRDIPQGVIDILHERGSVGEQGAPGVSGRPTALNTVCSVFAPCDTQFPAVNITVTGGGIHTATVVALDANNTPLPLTTASSQFTVQGDKSITDTTIKCFTPTHVVAEDGWYNGPLDNWSTRLWPNSVGQSVPTDIVASNMVVEHKGKCYKVTNAELVQTNLNIEPAMVVQNTNVSADCTCDVENGVKVCVIYLPDREGVPFDEWGNKFPPLFGGGLGGKPILNLPIGWEISTMDPRTFDDYNPDCWVTQQAGWAQRAEWGAPPPEGAALNERRMWCRKCIPKFEVPELGPPLTEKERDEIWKLLGTRPQRPSLRFPRQLVLGEHLYPPSRREEIDNWDDFGDAFDLPDGMDGDELRRHVEWLDNHMMELKEDEKEKAVKEAGEWSGELGALKEWEARQTRLIKEKEDIWQEVPCCSNIEGPPLETEDKNDGPKMTRPSGGTYQTPSGAGTSTGGGGYAGSQY